MNFKAFLTEVFDTPAPWTIQTHVNRHGTIHTSSYRFIVGNHIFVAELTHMPNDTTDAFTYTLAFGKAKSSTVDDEFWVTTYKRRDNDEPVSGKYAMKVWSTVLAATRDFIQKHKIHPGDWIVFTANDDDPRQVKFYQLVAKQLVSLYGMTRLSYHDESVIKLEKL